jgi:predicted alpha/beta superfamily hydrolase
MICKTLCAILLSSTTLLGHSYGGLFALYALEQRPALFQRIVAASPVVGWDHRLLFTARDRLKAPPGPVRLDLSVEGDEPLKNDNVAFAKLLDEIKPAGLDYRFTIYAGENHNSGSRTFGGSSSATSDSPRTFSGCYTSPAASFCCEVCEMALA